jgi:fatty acid desaturase
MTSAVEESALAIQRQQMTLDNLTKKSPMHGLSHAFIHAFVAFAIAVAVGIFWQHDFRLAILGSIPMAIVFTAIFVTAHDCVHETYSGIKVFDEHWSLFWTRLVGWPQHSYKIIHKLHHDMVGSDFDDPERLTYLKSEFEAAKGRVLTHIHHQWLLNIFCFGGVGFVAKYWLVASKNTEMYPQIKMAMRKDLFGIAVMFAAQLGVALYFDVLGGYIISFFIVERIAGGLLQFRALSEHYGLWSSRADNVELSRILSARNIKAGTFSRWLFNDLCFHSIHHAFPLIPWYRVGEAQLIFSISWSGLKSKGLLPKETYSQVFLDGVRSWRLIDDR